MNINLAQYVVRSENGSVDVDATLAQFHTDLTAWNESQRVNQETTLAAMIAVYEASKASAMVYPSLIAATASVLKVDFAAQGAFALVGERVRAVVASNPALFQVRKGKNAGGVAYMAHPSNQKKTA